MASKDADHAALLLALSPKGAPKPGDDGDDIEKTAASDIMDAVKERDTDALQDALKRFVSSCMSSYDKDDSSDADS
jgi:DNA-binding GntR family transcriptional regulator